MSIQELKARLGEHARDIKLNLGNVLSEEGAPDLTQKRIFGIALAAAYATRQPAVVQAVLHEANNHLREAEIHAAKAAATIMAMNNIYYRFTHLVSDKEIARLPARLRMNIIASPGIDKADFELYALAVSAINGCGMCMDAHVHEIVKGGVSRTGVQSCIRIAAVIHALAQAVTIGEMEGAAITAA